MPPAVPQSCFNSAPAVLQPRSQSSSQVAMLLPQSRSPAVAKMNNSLAQSSVSMPDCYNDNNITKYITSTICLIFRSEYPTFVNHMIANTSSNTQGIPPVHSACIYLVLFSIAPQSFNSLNC